jgi:hypothetical protein
MNALLVGDAASVALDGQAATLAMSPTVGFLFGAAADRKDKSGLALDVHR